MLATLLLLGLVLVAAVTDFAQHKIYNWTTYTGLLIALALNAAGSAVEYSPELAEEIISQNKADLVALGRQLITDPEWANKAREGRFEDILACDSCNKNCVKSIPENRERLRYEDLSLCSTNPRAGKEHLPS